MRDEFYADRRDLWKWTVALDQAAERNIVYVAMYRQNRARLIPSGVRSDVATFFADEWEYVARELKCARIHRLSKKIVPLLDPYDLSIADDYFTNVCRHIASRANGENCLVFVDPDTGIGEGRLKPEHVALKHLALIWRSMHSGDELLVYQHNLPQKREDWVSRKQRDLAKALQVREFAVESKPHADVCFFYISK